jgi:hypothetical protein
MNRYCSHFPRSGRLLLIAAALTVGFSAEARAEYTAPQWQLALGGGVGHGASTLPSERGASGVRSAAFPAVGVELGVRLPLTAAWGVGIDIGYASSVGYEVERHVFDDGSESAAARKQELAGRALLDLALSPLPLAFCAGLGYGARAFTTDTPLVSPASYLLTGPHALAGVRVWLFAQNVELRMLGELGMVLTASRALTRAGADRIGASYAASAALRVHLTEHWNLALSYRLARASRAHRGGGQFHDDQGFLFASVAWQGGS